MMKRYLMTMIFVVLVLSAAFGQEKNSGSADGGPSLEATMRFLQEKIKDKATGDAKIATFLDVVANPAKCQMTLTQRGSYDRVRIITFAFRDVEKIQVMPYRDYFRTFGIGELTTPGDPFAVITSMTRNDSVDVHYKKGTDHGKKDVKQGDWFIVFGDEDLADRVAKAMLHAVEFCGGGAKEEPF
jgi:hypothetical protein